MAKRRFDFDSAPEGSAPAPASPAAGPPAAAGAPAPAPTPPPVRSGGARQPGLRRKPAAIPKPAITAVVERHDHQKLATLFLTGLVEDADNIAVMQFRDNGDIEDASQRALGRFIAAEIRDHANRPMAVLRDGVLMRISGEPIGYLAGGRIDNEARATVGYYHVGQAPGGDRPIEALVAAYLLWFQPNIWREDQP